MRFAWSVLILTLSKKINIGDMVKWDRVPHQFSEVHTEYGVVVQISKTGHHTLSAKILCLGGSTDWINMERLEIISEGR